MPCASIFRRWTARLAPPLATARGGVAWRARQASRDGGEKRTGVDDRPSPPVPPSSRIGRFRSLACDTSPRKRGEEQCPTPCSTLRRLAARRVKLGPTGGPVGKRGGGRTRGRARAAVRSGGSRDGCLDRVMVAPGCGPSAKAAPMMRRRHAPDGPQPPPGPSRPAKPHCPRRRSATKVAGGSDVVFRARIIDPYLRATSGIWDRGAGTAWTGGRGDAQAPPHPARQGGAT